MTEEITYEAGVLASNPEIPVYYLDSNSPGPTFFSNYSNTAPPESKFAVPPACAKALEPKTSPHHGGFYKPRFGVRFRHNVQHF